MFGWGFFIVVTALLFLYFLPTFVGFARGHPSAAAILVLNIFLGWTFIGWVVALVWACAAIRQQPMVVINQNPPAH